MATEPSPQELVTRRLDDLDRRTEATTLDVRAWKGAAMSFEALRDRYATSDPRAAALAQEGVVRAAQGLVDHLLAERGDRIDSSSTARARILGAMTRLVGELKHPLANQPERAELVAKQIDALRPLAPTIGRSIGR